MKLIIQDRKVCNIPILDIYEVNEKEKRPVVIMLHGGKGRKEKYIERALKYARSGYFVTLFDAYGHGELKDVSPKVQMTGYDKTNIDKLFSVYFETSKYINIIIDAYKDIKYADPNRIALIGVSMGAKTVYYNIAKERKPGVKAAVAINGLPSWVNSVRTYVKSIPNGNEKISENQIIEAERYIETIEPLNYAQNLNDFSLLILNGKEDKIMPVNEVKKAYARLESNYDNKELIKFIEYEGVGHVVTDEMLEEAYEWIESMLRKK